MVFDRLEHASTYDGLSARLRRALRHLTTIDWGTVAEGRHDLEGDDLFAIVSEYLTRPSDDVPWEAHRRYIDVQYVHAGSERIGHAALGTLEVGSYESARDMVTAAGTGGFITMNAGSFAIFWPQDAHRPGIAIDRAMRVRKVVLKVAVDEGTPA